MIVVQYILPALRVAIAKDLIEKHGLRRTDVADKMAVTPATITQYLKKSRGDIASGVVESSDKVMDLVSEISRDIARGDSSPDHLLNKICIACRTVRAERLICKLHVDAMPSLGDIESCACSLGLVGWTADQTQTEISGNDA